MASDVDEALQRADRLSPQRIKLSTGRSCPWGWVSIIQHPNKTFHVAVTSQPERMALN